MVYIVGTQNYKYKLNIFYRERSGSVVECLTRDRGFKPHQRHCIVVLKQDLFILA